MIFLVCVVFAATLSKFFPSMKELSAYADPNSILLPRFVMKFPVSSYNNPFPIWGGCWMITVFNRPLPRESVPRRCCQGSLGIFQGIMCARSFQIYFPFFGGCHRVNFLWGGCHGVPVDRIRQIIKDNNKRNSYRALWYFH